MSAIYCVVILDCNGIYYREVEKTKPDLYTISYYERHYSAYLHNDHLNKQEAIVVNVYEVNQE